jgi:hypothetical protein
MPLLKSKRHKPSPEQQAWYAQGMPDPEAWTTGHRTPPALKSVAVVFIQILSRSCQAQLQVWTEQSYLLAQQRLEKWLWTLSLFASLDFAVLLVFIWTVSVVDSLQFHSKTLTFRLTEMLVDYIVSDFLAFNHIDVDHMHAYDLWSTGLEKDSFLLKSHPTHRLGGARGPRLANSGSYARGALRCLRTCREISFRKSLFGLLVIWPLGPTKFTMRWPGLTNVPGGWINRWMAQNTTTLLKKHVKLIQFFRHFIQWCSGFIWLHV